MTYSHGAIMPNPSGFWDRIARKYAKSPIADQASYEKKLEMTRRYFTPDSDVFEFGCGTGSTAILHAPHVRHIDATDISANMLEIARTRMNDAGVGNITFERAGIDEFAAPAERYDVVMGMSILHLLADRKAAIAKARHMLKPGGVFITSTACLGDSVYRYFGLVAAIGRLFGLLPLVKVFGMNRLVKEMEDAGFVIEHQWRPDPRKSAFIIARKPA